MRQLVIQVPDLEFLPGGAGALPARLTRLLGRARRIEAGPDALIARALGLDALPAAGPLTRLASRADAEGSAWLRFDPVAMLPDLTEVWLEKPVPLDFGNPALQPLVDELQQMLAAEGLEWAPEPGRGCGVVGLQELPDVHFPPLPEIPGRRLAEVLPEGPDARRWRRLINESQMVFHQFRPLARADQRGTGLWFWGPGRIPAAPLSPALSSRLKILDASHDVLLQGLANWLGVEVEQAGAGGLGDMTGDHDVLLKWPIAGESPVQSLAELTRHWIAPARGFEVTLIGSLGAWQIGPRERLAFWRRRPPAGFAGDAS